MGIRSKSEQAGNGRSDETAQHLTTGGAGRQAAGQVIEPTVVQRVPPKRSTRTPNRPSVAQNIGLAKIRRPLHGKYGAAKLHKISNVLCGQHTRSPPLGIENKDYLASALCWLGRTYQMRGLLEHASDPT